MPYFLIKIFILLEYSHLLCVLSVIYTTKHIFAYFMNVIVLNVYGLTESNAFQPRPQNNFKK